MKKNTKPISIERILPLFLILFCAVLFYVATWSSWASSKTKDSRSKQIEKLDHLRNSLKVDDLKVTNKTQHLYIAGIEKAPNNQIHLSLRNDYTKKITSYEISIGSKVTLADYIYSEHEDGIAPGSIVDEYQAIDIDPELYTKGIAVLAVMFEDGTSDGDPAHVKEIIQYRSGGNIQMGRVLSMLEKVKTLPKNEITVELTKIKASLNSSENQDSRLPQYVKFGINDARMILSRELETLGNRPLDEAESQINRILEKYKQNKSRSSL